MSPDEIRARLRQLAPEVEAELELEDLVDDERFLPPVVDEPVCMACGCTSSRGCPGGCVWAAEDLCSRCVEGRSPR